MSVFTSDRERRLWLLVIFAIVAIYGTLGLAGKLEDYLRERKLLDVSFFIGFLLVIVAIVGIGLKQGLGRVEI
jgi:succinate dehydrogenase hydrophobic anchor subunit